MYFQAFLSLACFISLSSGFFSLWNAREKSSAYDCMFPTTQTPRSRHWVDTWTAVPQADDYTTALPTPFNQADVPFADTTIRQTLRLTIGADKIRIRLSNVFGLNDLPITKVTVALPLADNGEPVMGSSSIVVNTLQNVSFSGSDSIVIPKGGLAVSDPMDFPTQPGEVITLNVHLHEGQASQSITYHRVSRTTSWLISGDYTAAAKMPSPRAKPSTHWYFVSAVEAWRPSNYGAFVVIGDSITDGRASDRNEHGQWPNLLFDQMQASPNPELSYLSVLNQGAGGNQELYDGKGPSAVSRLDRDVLAHSGVKYAMILEGTNDIARARPNGATQPETEQRLIQSYKQTITRIHAQGIPIFGSTITPRCNLGPPGQQTRLNVNEWIRTSGWFDAVIDFDEVLRDPNNHTQLAPLFDSGDCLHPSEAGYHEMAAKFPLELFEKFKDGVNGFN